MTKTMAVDAPPTSLHDGSTPQPGSSGRILGVPASLVVITLALIPMLAGIACTVAYAQTRDDAYMSWGLMTLFYIGPGIFIMGLATWAISLGCKLHRRPDGTGRLTLMVVAPLVLLLNLPVAFACAGVGFDHMTRFYIHIHTRSGSEVEFIRVTASNDTATIRAIPAGQIGSTFLKPQGPGNDLELEFEIGSATHSHVLDYYTTTHTGGDVGIEIGPRGAAQLIP